VSETGSKNLFVGNLSWNVDDEWLYREFEEFGEITGARVISDKDSGRSRGFGYVEFAKASDAAAALNAKKGALIDGREANVDFSVPRDNAAPRERANKRAQSFGDSKNPESDTLFIGNISFEANEDMLGEAFSAHGKVVNIRLPTDM
jgi:nucleolin